MIQAVFFDFYNTLAGFKPPREELHADACQEMGLVVSPGDIRTHLSPADEFYHQESLRLPVSARSEAEQDSFYTRYEQMILRGVGIEVSAEVALAVFRKVRQHGWRIYLYEDSLPVLRDLRRLGKVVGIVSNVDRDLTPYCQELGLDGEVDFVVTSWEVGVGKPHPDIFMQALKQARIAPEHTLHVGDQYNTDVLGARGVGIKGLLLDRDGNHAQITDCPRLRTLWEVKEYI